MIIKKTAMLGFILMLAGALVFSGAQQAPVDPVHWSKLTPFLGNFNGWDAVDDAEGSTVSMMNFKITEAERDYSDGSRDVTLSIVDGGFVPMVYASFTMYTNFNVDTSEEYIQGTTIAGFPAVKSYEYDSNEATVMVLVEDRFLITFDGENFESLDDLLTMTEQFDFAGLAALAD